MNFLCFAEVQSAPFRTMSLLLMNLIKHHAWQSKKLTLWEPGGYKFNFSWISRTTIILDNNVPQSWGRESSALMLSLPQLTWLPNIPEVPQGQTNQNKVVFLLVGVCSLLLEMVWAVFPWRHTSDVEQVHWRWLLFPQVPWSILARAATGTDFISARSTCPQHRRCSPPCTCAQGAEGSRKLSHNTWHSPHKVLRRRVGSAEHEILLLHCNLQKNELCSWRRGCKNHSVIVQMWKWGQWSQHHIPPGFIQLLPSPSEMAPLTGSWRRGTGSHSKIGTHIIKYMKYFVHEILS